MKKSLLLIVLSALFLSFANAKDDDCGFALVIDKNTYSQVSMQVEEYLGAIQRQDKKKTFLIVVDRQMADKRGKEYPLLIRDTLKYLFNNKGLEGALFVGDIPVPMIRRAHHLSTAFKMNPNNEWRESSIPSDRFYDDFHLDFSFLKQDEKDSLLYYYNLSPSGGQQVDCSIYSARVKPVRDDHYTEQIARFLSRAAAEKRGDKEVIDNVFHFGGHGNSSESFNARIDENRAMYEQFFYGLDSDLAWKGRVNFINFDEDKYVKFRLLQVLADKTVDIAHLHTHGGVDAQYISKEPYTNVTSEHLDRARSALRKRMRSAKDKEKTKASILKSYNVSSEWLEDYDTPELRIKDSTESANVDISLEDLRDFSSGVKVLILDACFNGAYLHDDFVTPHYLFTEGSSTMVVFSNSVNIIQDHWKGELIGTLQQGISLGEWAKQNMTLESHIFGDPTYSFKSQSKESQQFASFVRKPTLSKAKEFFKNSKYSDVRAYALKYMAKKRLIAESEILDILKNDRSMNVRMEALTSLARYGKDIKIFSEAIRVSIEDNFELIRRMGARYAENCGDDALLNAIVYSYLKPLETTRVRYHLLNALALYPYDNVKKQLDEIYTNRGGVWPQKADYDFLHQRLLNGYKSDLEAASRLNDNSYSAKERAFTVSAQRNLCKLLPLDGMLSLMKNSDADKELRIKAIEALGWYVYSVECSRIYSSCVEYLNEIEKDNSQPNEIIDELKMTISRLADCGKIMLN